MYCEDGFSLLFVICKDLEIAMAIESRLTAKGQTTIPVAIRDFLKIGPGDRIQYVFVEGGVEIVPRNRPSANLFGRLESFAIPGTTLEDYKEAVSRTFAEDKSDDQGKGGKAA
jgi:AbrB family looped-hinge helix DNA binding protein